MSESKPHRTCPQCGGRTAYAERYDMFGCPKCLVWTEEPCGCNRINCEFERAWEDDGCRAPTAETFTCVRAYAHDCACPKCAAKPAHETRGWSP